MSVIELRPDIASAERFLRSWSVPFPVLSAKHVDPETGEDKRFETRAFPPPVDWPALHEWFLARQGGSIGWANIYYTTNAVIRPENKKAERDNIAALVALHVDLDVPPLAEAEHKDEAAKRLHQEEGIKRLLSLVEKYAVESPPGSKKFDARPPSDIIISGGGVQALWRLASPIHVGGDEAIAEDLKRYNIQIERDLGGDHCHDITRILRLPGSVNIPNIKKRKDGRQPALASWYSASARTYTLSDFIPAAAVPEEKKRWAGAAFDDTGDYEIIAPDDHRLNNLDAKWKRYGREGDFDGKFTFGGKTDRSKMCMAFCSAALRAKVEPNDVASILMDKMWVVGACIRDKGATVRRHLKRIIERAQKFVDEDVLKQCVIVESDWVKTAEQFMLHVWSDLLHHQGNFYARRRHFYEPMENDSVGSAVRKFLHTSLMWTSPDSEPVRYHPNTHSVNETVAALQDLQHQDRDTLKPPCWLEDAELHPLAGECLCFTNGILHAPSRTLLEGTPNFFSVAGLEFAFDPKAAPPELWLQTIAQYWPIVDGVVPKEHLLLQEIMGYLMTQDNRLQKLFFFVGATRGGKGLISRIIKKMIGPQNVVEPSMSTLSGDFGAEPLIDKSLAIISEVSFGRYDDRNMVTDFIKKVSGGDGVNLNRKNKQHWQGNLLIRFLILANVIPNFSDDSRAIGARIVPLKFNISWEGREDASLETRLQVELPAIVNWALDGYDRLMKSGGRFTEPESATETREEFARMASPIRAWVQECCVLDDGQFTTEDVLYINYKQWCDRNNQTAVNKTQFIEGLIAGHSGRLKRHREHANDDGKATRPRGVKGVRINGARPAAAPTQADERGDGEIPF